MTDYLTLTEFIPGTKAKAQEVNANFAVLKDAISTKASLNGDSSKTFSVSEATASEHAIRKSQMDSLGDEINQKMENLLGRFCLKSGNLTNGEADLMSFSGTTLSFKIGSTYSSLKWNSANGTLETITTLADITGTSINGTYSVIKELGVANAVATSSNITQGKTFPTSPSNGDYHCLTAAGLNTYKYTSGAWVETQYIQIGTVTVANNTISFVKTNPYNYNGYNVQGSNVDYIVESWISSDGNSFYKKFKSGLIRQGAIFAGTDDGVSITFPVAFKNTNYFITGNARTQSTSSTIGVPNFYNITTTGAKIFWTSAVPTFANYVAEGY